ncbi:FitA-like ribbon-helix-helix domain-containing protein [Spartinivicinus poritis]|uniref:Antitoxin FitA-like ribbon-helix-helix domain-containing protein n=1 Tax=Spartinivicinus poritis TaxID=2994640 RepID=A0ABT5UAC6_9GAMM|nr:hypothetical protein [Spartinivicinus sp. A2-2]MDE1462089.1 hypothetical protein [Spartinivicinus sp. A2-2]
MPNILIRDVDEKLDKALRVSAAHHNRTREAEIKAILEDAVTQKPRKRELADVLQELACLDDTYDIDELFGRSESPARDTD